MVRCMEEDIDGRRLHVHVALKFEQGKLSCPISIA